MKGVTAWVIGGLIILAMAFTGVTSLENFGRGSALQVGKIGYSVRDVELEVRGRIATLQQQNPGLTREQAVASGVQQQTIEVLTLRALQENEAKRLGLVAPDEVVRAYIENIDVFKNPETGRFDNQRLAFALQQQGLSVSRFGELAAGEIVRTQMVEALAAAAPAPDSLTRLLLLRQFEERRIRVAELPVGETEEPTDEEFQKFYTDNQSRYLSPEYRTYTVLTIKADDVADDIEVSEEDIQQLFQSRQGQLAAAQTRSYRQVSLNTTDAQQQAAAQAESGGDVDAIAEATGATVMSFNDQARNAIINEELAEAVFAAEVGARLGPIETPFGVLYAEVSAINKTETPSLDDQRDALTETLRAEIAEERLVELVEAVELARDEGATLDEAASTLGLEARTVGPVDAELFTPNGSIAALNRVLAAEGRTLTTGEESAAIRLEDGYGFVGVESITPPAPQPFEEVKASVRTAFLERRGDRAANDLAARFVSLQAQGQTFDEATLALGGAVKEGLVTLTDAGELVPRETLPDIFAASVGQATTVLSSDNAVYGLVVTDVDFGNGQEVMAVMPVVAEQFGEQLTEELYATYIEALQAETKVTTNERELARALGQGQ